MYPKVITHLEISKKAAADLVRETNAIRVLANVEVQHLQQRDDPLGVLWNGDRVLWRNGWIMVPNGKSLSELAAAAPISTNAAHI